MVWKESIIKGELNLDVPFPICNYLNNKIYCIETLYTHEHKRHISIKIINENMNDSKTLVRIIENQEYTRPVGVL